MTFDLLPCPFCGNDAICWPYDKGRHQVVCSDTGCKISPRSIGPEGQAIANWNSRVRHPEAGETGAECDVALHTFAGLKQAWLKQGRTLAAARSEIAHLKAWRDQSLASRNELDSLIDTLKATMAQMAEALEAWKDADAMDQDLSPYWNAIVTARIKRDEALNAYRKLTNGEK